MHKFLFWLPNFITLINLFCGSIAISELFKEHYNNVLWLFIISLVADFSDGLIARSLKAQSVIGKDLDSLADLVTFGLLPSFVLFHLAEQQEHSAWNYLCFSIVLFSAVRLAKFNHDSRQTYYFVGLPTPANALLILSFLIFLISENPDVSEHSLLLKWNAVFFSKIIYSTKALRFIALLTSLLLITPINLISLKFSKFTFNDTKHQWILLIGIITLIILFGKMFLFWAMIWYLLWSVLWYYFIL